MLLLSLMVGLSLLSLGAPLSHAVDEEVSAIKSSSHFDVFDVFNNADDNGDLDPLPEEIMASAEAENVSPVGALILRVINILSLLVGTVAFVVIVIGGFLFMTSAGNDSQVDKAKNIMSQAIFGLVLAFMSYFIVTFVLSFLYE